MVSLESADVAGATRLLRAIQRELPGIIATTGSGDWYLFYDPNETTVPERRFPFCTIMTGDRYDGASDLDRDASTYRVNLGVDRPSYEALFGPAPRQAAGYQVIETGVDYKATDTLMPHPFYAPLHWVCVVNPREQTTRPLADLLLNAHRLAKRRYRNRRARPD
jgi:hypothetical protein